MLQQDRENRYPNLRSDGYSVTSEDTIHKKVKYNCVAWAVIGDTGKWWQSGNHPGYYWPKGIPDDDSFQSYVELFKLYDFRTRTNADVEPLSEKIAIYAYPDGEFAHVAYQLLNGWTSKLGDWQDIKHKTLKALEGQYYGDVNLIMKRRCTLRGFLLRIAFNWTCRFWPARRRGI